MRPHSNPATLPTDWAEQAVADLPALATTQEVATTLRTTRRNLYRWLSTGKLPVIRHSAHSEILIPRAAIAAFLRANQVSP